MRPFIYGIFLGHFGFFAIIGVGGCQNCFQRKKRERERYRERERAFCTKILQTQQPSQGNFLQLQPQNHSVVSVAVTIGRQGDPQEK